VNQKQIEKCILEAADDAQALVDAEFAKCGWTPKSNSALQLAGLRDGKAVVLYYLEHGEAGVAFEHLVYMVRETRIELTNEMHNRFRIIGSAMHVDVDI